MTGPLEVALLERKALRLEAGTTITSAGWTGPLVGSPGCWPTAPASQMFPVDPPVRIEVSGWYRVDVVDGVPSIELLVADE